MSYLQELRIRDQGHYCGVGLVIEYMEGKIIIFEVVNGSPAERAGVQPGSQVISVDAENVSNYNVDYVSEKIMGTSGTTVEIETVLRGKSRVFKLVRGGIQISPPKNSLLRNFRRMIFHETS